MGIGTSISALFCQEDPLGEEVIDALPAAELLVNVNKDAWFGETAPMVMSRSPVSPRGSPHRALRNGPPGPAIIIPGVREHLYSAMRAGTQDEVPVHGRCLVGTSSGRPAGG